MNFGEAKSASTKDLSMWVMHSHTMPEKKENDWDILIARQKDFGNWTG